MSDAGPGDRAADGLEHLRAAALELIEAARAFLDVAEELVSDRERAGEVLATLSNLAEAATRPGRRAGGASEGASVSAEDGTGPGPAVQHIDIT